MRSCCNVFARQSDCMASSLTGSTRSCLAALSRSLTTVCRRRRARCLGRCCTFCTQQNYLRRWTWTLASSVRGRLPGLYQHDSRRRLGCCRPALNMLGGRRDLAESKSSSFERDQNTCHVGGLSTTARQARYGRGTRLVIHCTGPGDGS